MTTPTWVLLIFLGFAGGVCAMGLGAVYLRHLRWKRNRRAALDYTLDEQGTLKLREGRS